MISILVINLCRRAKSPARKQMKFMPRNKPIQIGWINDLISRKSHFAKFNRQSKLNRRRTGCIFVEKKEEAQEEKTGGKKVNTPFQLVVRHVARRSELSILRECSRRD